MATRKILKKILIFLLTFTGDILTLQRESPTLKSETPNEIVISELPVVDPVKNRNCNISNLPAALSWLHPTQSSDFKHFAGTATGHFYEIPLHSSMPEEDIRTKPEDDPMATELAATPAIDIHDSLVDLVTYQYANALFISASTDSSAATPESGFQTSDSTTGSANEFSSSLSSYSGASDQASDITATPIMSSVTYMHSPVAEDTEDETGSSGGGVCGGCRSDDGESSESDVAESSQPPVSSSGESALRALHSTCEYAFSSSSFYRPSSVSETAVSASDIFALYSLPVESD